MKSKLNLMLNLNPFVLKVVFWKNSVFDKENETLDQPDSGYVPIVDLIYSWSMVQTEPVL